MIHGYRDETVNGVAVHSEIRESFGCHSYRVSWEGGSEEGYGFRDFDDCEQAMADAFRRAMESGRIGGIPVKFDGFPVSY